MFRIIINIFLLLSLAIGVAFADQSQLTTSAKKLKPENTAITQAAISTPQKVQASVSQTSSNQPNNSWSHSDLLTAIIALVGFFQFLALFATVWVMIKSSRRQLKAYVFAESSFLMDRGHVAGQEINEELAGLLACHLIVKNSGQTPAYRVVHWSNIEICKPDEQDSLTIPKLEAVSISAIPPGGTIQKAILRNNKLSSEEIDDLKNEKKHIYLYGRIEYRDIFNKKRFTNYRLRYQGKYPPPNQHMLLFCDQGNEAN